MAIFMGGVLTGTILGGFIASLFAVSARQRGCEDAEELASELERHERSPLLRGGLEDPREERHLDPLHEEHVRDAEHR